MMKNLKFCILLASVAFSINSYAAAHFSIADTAIVAPETTVHTTCVNTRGFYFEMGERDIDSNARVVGFNRRATLDTNLKLLTPPSWLIVYDSRVNTKVLMSWSGNQTWLHWLQDLSREQNLAIIVDWNNHQLFVNRL